MQGNNVSRSNRMKLGTIANLSCKSSYKLPVMGDPAFRAITCLEDGSCGPSFLPISSIMRNTHFTRQHAVRERIRRRIWSISVARWYLQKEKRGARGNLWRRSHISNNLVVSAAHCFCNEVYNKVEDKSKYAVGKRYRDWNAENYAQKSMLANISLPMFRSEFSLPKTLPFSFRALFGIDLHG
ncbi:uncharacterized protein LOC107994061 [Apis cerana]|uniref:uncharacterized protein LOC107994061 n=1 Tax=Apis cerana TaxID=7461 RepID=UPI002B23BE7B|nr:uncharacterized protein LOC107994061 [Apis cerana]